MLWVSTSDFIPSLWCWVCCAVSGTIPEARIQFLPFRLCVSALTQRQMCKELNTQLREFLGALDAREMLSPLMALRPLQRAQAGSALTSGRPTEAALLPMPRPWDPQPAAWAPFATKLGNLSDLGILWSSVISGWFIIRSKVRFSRLHISPYGNFLSVS